VEWFASGRAGHALVPRRSPTTIAVAVALVLSLAAAAALALRKHPVSNGLLQGEPVALALSLKPHQSIRYQMDMVLNGVFRSGGDSVSVREEIKGTMGWRVLSVDRRGVATIQIAVSDVRLTINGRTVGQAPQSLRTRIARDGRVLTGADIGTTSGRGASPGMPGMDQFAPLLPDHPVGAGQTWTRQFNQVLPFGPGRLRFSSHNRFVRWEGVGIHRVAVVESSMSVPLDLSINLRRLLAATGIRSHALNGNASIAMKGHVDISQTAWLEPAAGLLTKSVTTGRFDIQMILTGVASQAGVRNQAQAFSGTITLTLQHVP
jgi:hypothetical protein